MQFLNKKQAYKQEMTHRIFGPFKKKPERKKLPFLLRELVG